MARFVLAFLLCAGAAQAQMLEGADDPAFRTALTTLLAADDPAAVAALRDLAEAGNPAALVALPFAVLWVPPKGSLKEKNAQRQVGGVTAQDAAALAHRATAVWDVGRFDDAMVLPDRAAEMLALGEPEKAAVLIGTWLNQSGGSGDLPPQLFTDDTPAMLGALTLVGRLTNAVYGNGGVAEEAALLLSQMREDRLEGWVAYVHLRETRPEIFEMIGDPIAGTGLSAGDTQTRIDDASAVRTVWWTHDEVPTPAAAALHAREVLQGRAELLPATLMCQARCPDTVASCEAAMLAYPGHSYGHGVGWQPFADVLDPAEFAASDRGLAVLIGPRNDPAAATDRATAEALDACYAEVLAYRDTLVFGPSP